MRKIRFFSIALLAVVLCFALAGSALADQIVKPTVTVPVSGLKVTESYASGLYYTKLLQAIANSAGLSPAERFVKIAMSQNGYTGSSKSSNLSGTVGSGTEGNYNEYNNNMSISGEPWCAAFVSWCAKAAGLSTSVMPRGTPAGTWQSTPGNGTLYWLWDESFTKYNTSVTIQVGDIVLFNPSDYIGRNKDFSAYDKNGNVKTYNTANDNCEGHYLSRTGTSHVAIVAEAKKNSDGSYTIKTIERRSKKVGQQTIKTNDGSSKYGYRACSHVYGSGQTIPKLKAVYRPNWSAASVWSASQFDNEVPVVSSLTTKNHTSSGFDLVVKATDNNAVSKIRLDVWSGGVRKYDQTFDVTNAANFSQTFSMKWSDLGTSDTYFRICVYAIDEYGNRSVKKYIDVYSDTTAPGNIALNVTNLTNTGYDLTVSAQDASGIQSVKIVVNAANVERYNQTHAADGSTDFTKTYHFDFDDLDGYWYEGDLEGWTCINLVTVTDKSGNTSSPVRTDVYPDMAPPEILSVSMEQVDQHTYYMNVHAMDAVDIEKVYIRFTEDGAFCSEITSPVVGLKEVECPFIIGASYFPDDTYSVHHYRVTVMVYDSAGNCATYEIPDEMVFNDPNILPDEYYDEEGVWAFTISGDQAYITGLNDTTVTVETLGVDQWPTSVTKNGRVYPVAGTMQAGDEQASFADLPNFKKITGFPAGYTSIGGFAGCKTLESVVMNVPHVEAAAFKNCASLTDVELGEKLVSIGADAFAGCGSAAIRYRGLPEEWANVDVDAQNIDALLSGVSCKYNVVSECGNTIYDDTLSDKHFEIQATFSNDGYANGRTLLWTDATFELFNASGVSLGKCSKEIRYMGESVSLNWHTEEDLGLTLSPNTTYKYRVQIACNGFVYTSGMYSMKTEASVDNTIYVTDLALSYYGRTMTVGETWNVYRFCRPSEAADHSVTWKSSNTSVATVSSSGLITAVSAGTATITCTANGAKTANSVKKTCAIRVTSASSCSSCSTSYTGWYKVTGTSGSLAISSVHGASTSSGATKLGSIPEGAFVYITKATGYSGQGSSSGKYGHVTYNGVSGFCAMNYLSKVSGNKINLDLNGSNEPSGFATDYIFVYPGLPLNSHITGRVPTRTGYAFGGWYTENGHSRIYDWKGHADLDSGYWKTDSVYGIVWLGVTVPTLYADWNPRSYELTYDPCGGVMGKDSDYSSIVIYDSTLGNHQVVNNMPKKVGYSFKGWYTAKEGGDQVFNALGCCTTNETYWVDGMWHYPDNLKLYAQWEAADQTPPVIDNVEVYDVDETGFSVGCNVRDRIASVNVKVWTGVDSAELEEEFVEENVLEVAANVVDDYASARIDVPEPGESYSVLITATDTTGSSTSYLLSEDDRIYVDGYAPVIEGAEVVRVSEAGFTVACGVTDDTRVGRVQMLVWPDSVEMPEDQNWMTDEAHSAKLEDGRWIYEADAASDGLKTGAYRVAIRAWDVYEQASGTSVLSLIVPDAQEATPMAYGSHDGHVYVLCSAGSNAGWSAVSSACKAMGGHLATIESAGENAAIAAMMSQYASYDSKAWINGSGASYSNWNGTTPSNAKYAVMNLDGTWSGETSSKTHGFVCEFDADILKLPQLREIRSEAFAGTNARILVIPASCESIDARAFADCGALEFILIPEDAVINMADDAFDLTDAMVIAY